MRGYQSRRRLFVEPLESRRLLAAGKAELDPAGVLNVSGNGKNDSIRVSVADTALTVTFNKESFEFNTADVTGIHIDGGNGNDWIWVDDGVLVGAVIDGGHGNDRVHGGGGDDTITGDKGNDRLHGGGGVDTIHGDAGNDWLWGDDGDDVVHGDGGHDHVLGGAGNDQLFGDWGHDALDGGDGDDVLSGGHGKDHLHGRAGNDQLFGDEDKDHLWGDTGDDQLFGGDGSDHLWGGWDNDLLKGEAGDDHLDGGGGDNLLDGDSGRNHYKRGVVVDLDQNLVAELADSDPLTDLSGVATFQYVVENGVAVQKLVITVDHVPTDGVTPVDLPVTIDGTSVGTITVDPVTGHGSLTFTTSATPGVGELPFPAGVSLHAGSLITVGDELSGTFVAAFA